MEVLFKSGRCAPSFLEDLLQYDPCHVQLGSNILTDPPRKLEDGGVLPVIVNARSCRHRYMLKPEQSFVPAIDSRPDPMSWYQAASVCTECREHMTLTVEFGGEDGDGPCPNQAFPLHHLRYDPAASRPCTTDREPKNAHLWVDERRFVCSSPRCSAVITILIRPPRLSSEHISLLTDPSRIQERAQREIDRAPARFQGYTIPEPVAVLQNLKQYLHDALRDGEHKKIRADNKRFMNTIGEDCSALLEYLGFRYHVEPGPSEVCTSERPTRRAPSADRTKLADAYWFLPTTQPCKERPRFQDRTSILLDDVDKELLILIHARPRTEKTTARTNAAFHPINCVRELERCLGCVDCTTQCGQRASAVLTLPTSDDKVKSSRRTIDLSEDSPFYAGLGASSNFSDELLIYAYERQRDGDPDHAPYYLGWLQEIARLRPSEALQTKVAVMESSGEISRRDVYLAYLYFQVNPAWDDASITGAFHARLADAPKQETEARQHLRVIGIARQSEAILSAASNQIATYQDALVWLGAEESTADEFVVTLFTMKIEENPADTELGRNAVELIAETRNSHALRAWLSTGELGEIEMDAAQAYTRLGIQDRTLDDDTVLTTFDIRLAESPSQADDLRAALKAIGKDRKSQRIGWFLQTAQSPPSAASADWPVGLENIGNTCYLNSLLQFYFTVKPLRDLILGFSAVEMPVTPEGLAKKRVGGRKVSPKEIERAKKFVLELQKLFHTLITAPTSSITPERELARLTLIKSSDEEDYRRRSITSPQGAPRLGEIGGMPVQGPAECEEGSDTMEMEEMPMLVEAHAERVASDSTSEITLVGKETPDEAIDSEMTDAGAPASAGTKDESAQYVMVATKETKNLVSERGAYVDVDDMNRASTPPPLIDDAGSGSDKQDDGRTSDVAMTSPVADADADARHPPPDRPPPVPPRPKAIETTSRVVDELELGAQQDVTEVIGNVLFQLECALRPTFIDRDGEQHDEIKQLFYGKLRASIEVNAGASRTKEEYFSDIKVNVASVPRDIYAALDGAFDVQEVTMKDGRVRQYTSIAELPPILQIQVQRVQYDVENKKTYKSEAHLELREQIFLDRYMVSGADEPMLRKRVQTWRWKEELCALDERKQGLLQTETEADVSVPEVIDLTRHWLEDMQSPAIDGIQPEDEGTLAALVAGEQQATKELNGTASFGHYWIYIYDFQQQLWRKYNDGYVTAVPDAQMEIFEDLSATGSASGSFLHAATPYYLVYVQDDLKEAVVDPVCRHLEPAVAAQPASEMVERGGAAVGVNGMGWGGDEDEEGDGGEAAAALAMASRVMRTATAREAAGFNADGW
ncbi:MAG: ubiquitin-specific protease ubp2 [Phylliscum demangeonii]|nr:MAG: ubiquitin-specific protease ubp2 [Phylliscum demangeonii]